MKKRLELIDDKSSKFWEVEVKDNEMTVRFGKIGTDGTTKTKELADNAAALKEAEKLVKSKSKKGYQEIADGNSPAQTVQTEDPISGSDDTALLLLLENPTDDVKAILSQQTTYSKAVLEKMLCCGDDDITALAINYLSGAVDPEPAAPEVSTVPVELVTIPSDFSALRSLLESYGENNDLEAFTTLLMSISQSDNASEYCWDHARVIVEIVNQFINTNDNKHNITTKKRLITTFTGMREYLLNYQDEFPAIIAGTLDFALVNNDSDIETLIFDDLLNKPLLGNKLSGKSLNPDHIDDKQLCYNLSRYYSVHRLEQQLIAFIPKALELGIPVKQFKEAPEFSYYLSNMQIIRILGDFTDPRFDGKESETSLYLEGSDCEHIFDGDIAKLVSLESLHFLPNKPLDLPVAFHALPIDTLYIGKNVNIESTKGFKQLTDLHVEKPTEEKLKYLFSVYPDISSLELYDSVRRKQAKQELVIPANIKNLTQLEFLEIDRVKIDSLPDELGLLSRLETLKLNDVEGLTQLPASLGQLEKLDSLRCRNVQIANFPVFFNENKKITHLELSQIEPTLNFSDFPNLTDLEIYSCELSDDQIKTIGELKKLESLEISKFIEEMFTDNLRTVKTLDISGFGSQYKDLSSLLKLTGLRKLDISYLELFNTKKKREKFLPVLSKLAAMPHFREIECSDESITVDYLRSIYKRDQAVNNMSDALDIEGKNITVIGKIKTLRSRLKQNLLANGVGSVSEHITAETDIVLFNETDTPVSLTKWNGAVLSLGAYTQNIVKSAAKRDGLTVEDRQFLLTAAGDAEVKTLLKDIEKNPADYKNELYFLALSSSNATIKKKAKTLVSPLTDANLTYRMSTVKAIKTCEYLTEMAQSDLDVIYLAQLFDTKFNYAIKYIVENGDSDAILAALQNRCDNGSLNLHDQELNVLPKELAQLDIDQLDISFNNIKQHPDLKIGRINTEDNLIPVVAKADWDDCSRCRKEIDSGLMMTVNSVRFESNQKYYHELFYHLDCAAKSKPENFLEAVDHSSFDLSEPHYSDLKLQANALISKTQKSQVRVYPLAEVASEGGKQCAECKVKIKKNELRVAFEWQRSKKVKTVRYLHPDCVHHYDKSMSLATVLENTALKPEWMASLESLLQNPRQRIIPDEKQTRHDLDDVYEIISSERKNHEDLQYFFDCYTLNFRAAHYDTLYDYAPQVLEDAASVKLLLENGFKPISPYEKDKDLVTPMQMIAQQKVAYHADVVELLIEHGDDINNIDQCGMTVYQNAKTNGLKAFCEQLEKHGAETAESELTIWQALEQGIDKFEALVPVIEEPLSEEESKLIGMLNSTDPSNVELAKVMIDGLESKSSAFRHYLFVNNRNDEGETAIFKYVKNKDVLKLLISHCDLSVCDRDGNTALLHYLNSVTGALPMVKAFVKYGADLFALNAKNRGALHLSDNAKICEYLVANELPLEVRDSDGMTPIFYTFSRVYEKIKKGALNKVDMLIAAGADIETTNNEGKKLLQQIYGRSYAFDDGAESLLDQFAQRGLTLTEQEKKDAWW